MAMSAINEAIQFVRQIGEIGDRKKTMRELKKIDKPILRVIKSSTIISEDTKDYKVQHS